MLLRYRVKCKCYTFKWAIFYFIFLLIYPVRINACFAGIWGSHPFISEHYIDANCASPGPTGEFHAFNGNSNGWIEVSFDLSRFADQQIEVSLTYISDNYFTNTGVFVDDVVLDVDGVLTTQGWELGQAPWSIAPPPIGSPTASINWERSSGLISTIYSAAVATENTVYLPFGFEAISTYYERSVVMERLLNHLWQWSNAIPAEKPVSLYAGPIKWHVQLGILNHLVVW